MLFFPIFFRNRALHQLNGQRKTDATFPLLGLRTHIASKMAPVSNANARRVASGLLLTPPLWNAATRNNKQRKAQCTPRGDLVVFNTTKKKKDNPKRKTT